MRYRLALRLKMGVVLYAALGMLAACSDNSGSVPQDASAGAERAPAAQAMPVAAADFSGLAEGWNTFEPGGDTVCSDGSPYRFFVKQGDPERLMFYLEGGGACWEAGNCDPDIQPSYQVNLNQTDPSRAHGILAFDEPSNPFNSHTVVYAPYCSGDVHLGDAEQHYEVPSFEGHESHALHIRHRGWANAGAALNWTYEHIFRPQQIFVTGSSAGSIPSPFYAVELANQYPQANVVQLGDASGGYRGFANFSPYDVWSLDEVVSNLTYLNDIPADTFSFHHLYLAAALANPRVRFASYDNAEDEVQKQFLALGGTPTPLLQPLLEQNLAEISAAIPDFRYYVAGGTMHTILLRPEVYTYEVNGVRFLDWLAALANGATIFNVMCEDCELAPGS